MTLATLGFVTTEAQLGGDTDCFVLVSPAKGYAVTHTDLTLSSHLTAFSRVDGAFLGEVLHTVGARTDQLAYDPVTDLVYFPANAMQDPGVRVVNASTDSVLSVSSIPTGLPPRDVLVVRGSGPMSPAVPSGDDLSSLGLGAARPNPFTISTEFPFALSSPSTVAVDVFDTAGHRLRATERMPFGAGEHVVAWDGREGSGSHVAAGTYFVRFDASGATVTRKVTFARR